MRNLMGRLNARSDEELQRISIAWLLPGTARDRAALIAQLMRAMTDLRATRDFWIRRPADEQAMIAWFVGSGSDQGATIAEVKAAYRRLARTLHPDSRPGLTEPERRELTDRFTVVHAAYRLLLQHKS